MNWRNLAIAGTALLLLAAVNVGIVQRERLLGSGRVVLLELAPVDPRSLMQGDYMALRFRIANDAFGGMSARAKDGHLVASVDERGVAHFRRMADGTPPAPDEMLMRYRIRAGKPRFATDAWFFEEGKAARYDKARYGEFRVGADGEMILTGMRGEDLRPL